MPLLRGEILVPESDGEVTFRVIRISVGKKTRKLCPDCISSPGFVFPSHPDQLDNIQQIIQGIGPVPELMLLPHPGGHGQEEKLVDVRAAYGAVEGAAGGEVRPLPPKKPERLQEIPSSRSFRQEGVSCSSSGYPHSGPVITGWGPAGSSTAV